MNTELREEIIEIIFYPDKMVELSELGEKKVDEVVDLITKREQAAYDRGFHQQAEFYEAAEKDGLDKGYRQGVQDMQEACKVFIKTKAVGWNDLVEEYDVRLYEGIDAEAEKLLTNNQS